MSLFLYKKKRKKYESKSLPESIISIIFNKERISKCKEAPRYTCKSGSLTLEAAVIVPMLACLFAFVLFFFRIMEVQLIVQDALEDVAGRLAVYAELETRDEDDQTETNGGAEYSQKETNNGAEVGGVVSKEEKKSAVRYAIVVKSLFLAQIRDEELINRYIVGDALGISFWESEFDKDDIHLKVNYQMKFPVQLLGKRSFLISQQTKYRKWTGWKRGNDEESEDIWVYIADTGTVYHKATSCKYLELSIHSVVQGEVGSLRNEDGQKYRKCESCAEKNNKFGRVYITNYGDKYHTDLNCSGIKRTIEMIRLSQVGERRACSKCWD